MLSSRGSWVMTSDTSQTGSVTQLTQHHPCVWACEYELSATRHLQSSRLLPHDALSLYFSLSHTHTHTQTTHTHSSHPFTQHQPISCLTASAPQPIRQLDVPKHQQEAGLHYVNNEVMRGGCSFTWSYRPFILCFSLFLLVYLSITVNLWFPPHLTLFLSSLLSLLVPVFICFLFYFLIMCRLNLVVYIWNDHSLWVWTSLSPVSSSSTVKEGQTSV